jgi:threonyl-tRNA synthetase
VLSITERSADYAVKVADRLRRAGLRVASDVRNEKIGAKIRQAQLDKVPVMLVAGDREAADGSVAVRTRRGGDQGARPVEAFLDEALNWSRERPFEI